MKVTMPKQIIHLIMLLTLVAISSEIKAQCELTNKHFKAGEILTYQLDFKYGLLNMHAGTSTMLIVNDVYAGQPAYKTMMTAKSKGVANSIYHVNDTLTGYFSTKLKPLFFQKHAHEGKDYTQENVYYSYKNDSVYVHTTRKKNGDDKFDVTIAMKNCVYDLLSSIFYARVQDYTQMDKGESLDVNFISGKKMVFMQIILEGLQTIKAANGVKYECLVLKLNIKDDVFSTPNEAMTVYLSHDEYQLPIRIDTNLKIGSTKAILKKVEGL